jgi:hypothetical protein
MFIATFTTAHHLSLYSARLIQSMPCYSVSSRAILTSLSQLCLVIHMGPFIQASPPKLCMHFSSPSYIFHVLHPSHILYFINLIIFDEEYES